MIMKIINDFELQHCKEEDAVSLFVQYAMLAAAPALLAYSRISRAVV